MVKKKVKKSLPFILLAVVLISIAGVPLITMSEFGYVSGSQGPKITVSGLRVGKVYGVNEGGFFAPDRPRTYNVEGHLYTQYSKDPVLQPVEYGPDWTGQTSPVLYDDGQYYDRSTMETMSKSEVKEQYGIGDPDDYVPDEKDIGGTMASLDLDGKSGSDIMTDLISVVDQIKPVNKFGERTAEYNVLESYEWNKIVNGDNYHFKMSKYRLKIDFGMAMSPDSESEYTPGSGWTDFTTWLKIYPQDWTYARVDNATPIGSDPAFGLMNFKLSDIDVSPDGGTNWQDIGDTPRYEKITEGVELPIMSDMSEDKTPTTEIDSWSEAQKFEGKDLNPAIFSEDGWYVPIEIEAMSTSSKTGISSVLFGRDMRGDVLNMEASMSVFVVGKWEVKPETNVEWGGINEYKVDRAGIDTPFKALGSWISNNPFMFIGILIVLAVAVLAVLFIFLTIVTGGGGRK